MIRLATADEPDVLCLQELPAWALDRLERLERDDRPSPRSRAPPRIGPLPSTAWARARAHGAPRRHAPLGVQRPGERHRSSRRRLRARRAADDRAQPARVPPRARRAGSASPLVARLAWAKERRICQAVRLEAQRRRRRSWSRTCTRRRTGPTSGSPTRRCFRAAVFADALAAPRRRVRARRRPQRACRPLVDARASSPAPEWGFSRPGPGDRPRARARRERRPARTALARRAAAARRRAPVRPRAGRGRGRVTFEEARAAVPGARAASRT